MVERCLQIRANNTLQSAASEPDGEKAAAAVKAARRKSRDEQVVAVLAKHSVTLQRAFVLGCQDRPASQHAAWEGPSAAGSSRTLAMTSEQLLRQAKGESSASADTESDEAPAALAASPVVVHLPTPCTLHHGDLKECTWLDCSRPAQHLLICDVPRLQQLAALDAVAPDHQLSFEQYQRFIAIAAFLKYARDDVFEPTQKVEAAIANLIGWCNEEQAVAACRAGLPLLPPPPDAAAATAIQARVRAKLGRRLHLLRLWAATTLQLGARRRLARVVVAATAQRRRLEAEAQEQAAAAAQAAARAAAAAQAAANPRLLRRLSKAQRHVLLHARRGSDDETAGKPDEAGLAAAALRAARRHAARPEGSVARSRVSASSGRTAKTKGSSSGSKPSEGSGSSGRCRSRPRRRPRRGSAAAQTMKGVDINTLLAYAAELLPADGEEAPSQEAVLSPTKEGRPESEASWAQPEPDAPHQPEPRLGSPVKTVNLAAIQVRGRGKGTVALSIKAGAPAGAGGDVTNSGGSSDDAEEEQPPPRQPPPPPPPPLRTAPTATSSSAHAEVRRQPAPRAVRSSGPSPRASPLAAGSNSAPPMAMAGLSREPRVRAGPRASPLMAGPSATQPLPAAAAAMDESVMESSFQRRAGKRFTGVPQTLAAQNGPLFTKFR